MNIAIIIPSLQGGGSERAAQTIGNYYSKKGHKIFYLLMSGSGRQAYDVEGCVINTHIRFSGVSSNKRADFYELLRGSLMLRKLKKKFRIEVSISFAETANFLNVCSKTDERTVLSVRTTLSPRNELSGMIYDKRWIKLLYPLSDGIVAVSQYTKNDLVKNYELPARKITTIPNPAIRHDTQEYRDIWKHGDKCVVCVGRFDPVKQHDRIIRAFSYVKDSVPDAKLILLGKGRLEPYLKYICKKYELNSSVIFAGFVKDIGYYLQNAKVIVSASKVEGFPNSLVEGMSYGVPVITTDSPGGCGEIVGKKQGTDDIQYCKYGILTPYILGKAGKSLILEESEIKLGEAVVQVLSNKPLYENYSKHSIERAERYSMERVMSCWNNIIGIKGGEI